MEITREQVEWLRTLVADHKRLVELLKEGVRDEDPSATSEMYQEVGALADACAAHLDFQSAPADLPTPEEVEQMAKAAGADQLPF